MKENSDPYENTIVERIIIGILQQKFRIDSYHVKQLLTKEIVKRFEFRIRTDNIGLITCSHVAKCRRRIK